MNLRTFTIHVIKRQRDKRDYILRVQGTVEYSNWGQTSQQGGSCSLVFMLKEAVRNINES